MERAKLCCAFDRIAANPPNTRLEKFARNPYRFTAGWALKQAARALHTRINMKVKTFWGDDMTIVIPEEVSVKIFRSGYYEIGLTRMLLEYLEPGMTFCDIGSHYGYFTLLGAHLVDNEGQVHAFEPTPSTFSILRSNTAGKTNVVVNNVAVFSANTTITFNDFGVESSAYNSFTRARLSRSHRTSVRARRISVAAVSFDSYVCHSGIQPDFVKIDAEYAEYSILKGMQNTIRQYHPIITVEVGDIADASAWNLPTSRELLAYAMGLGYEAYECVDRQTTKHQLRDCYEFDNILLLPK